MGEELTYKNIGRRLAEFRKQKGLSQEDLAKRVKISRPSLAQIELGNRSISVLELNKFSIILGISFDHLLSTDSSPVELQESKAVYKIKSKEERISVPQLYVEKFRNTLLYILEKCAGKPNVGETVLNKLLYFIDFNYYELYEEHLTGARYKKLPYGPVPQELDIIINQMINNGQIQRIKTEYFGLQQTRYIPLIKADLKDLKATEKVIIDSVIEQMSDWSANIISDYSHKDIPWLVTKEGKEIDYELTFYREAPYSVRSYDERAQGHSK